MDAVDKGPGDEPVRVQVPGQASAQLISASGGEAADGKGQWSWALFEWARNPYVILITIYIFSPYFSSTVVGDPVRGQAIWGNINGIAGFFIAALGPILGAIADRLGARRKLLTAFGLAGGLLTMLLAACGPGGVATAWALRSVSNRRVWAAGDIADPVGLGPRAFTHVCSQHAGIIARSMLFRLPARLSYDALPRVTYTDPEIAQIGPTEAELRAAGRTDLTILRWPLAENDRLVAEGRAAGLVKLVVDAKGRLLGASLVGPGAGNMAGMLALMIGRRVSALAGAVLPYPTAQEAAKRAASEFYTPKLLSAPVKRIVGLLKHLP